ncbi:hypothetical protein N7G274_003979 [Stereocaulon virgatum]|uniref:Tim44-like domain-containing protein n=1 Tax=Stereocaulon virgatum TaxID=373712 RepID=A0ABR4ADL8_9LECA
MTLQQPPRWRPLMPFLYPRRRTWPVRSLHLQPSSQRNAVQKSMAVQRQEAQNKAANTTNKDNIVRGDLGLLPGTFVRPTRAKRPSILRETRKRMDLEWHWAKQKWASISGMIFYKFFSKKGKPRPKLDRRKIGPMAQVMYEKMYIALADGDIESIKSTCLDGITTSLRRRINSRRPDEKLVWTLQRYIGRPRIVSTRIVRLPDMDASALYQVVVQIRSLQSLRSILKGHNGSQETVMKDSNDRQHEVLEYLVMQKMMLNGNESSWKIWGMTEETRSRELSYGGRWKSKAGSPAIAK